jgi:tRNA(Ile)-lysidine synthase
MTKPSLLARVSSFAVVARDHAVETAFRQHAVLNGSFPMSQGSESEPGNGSTRPAREIGLVQRLRRSLDDFGESPPARVLVGYSGGADSLALLSLLASLAGRSAFELRAVHVDHGARDESSRDAQLAVRVAEQLGVALDVRQVSGERLARHAGVGREEALRRERYRIFADVATDHGADAVALAHHQRDQAETVLLHLLRGAGLRGASGMRVATRMRIPWWDVDDAGDYRDLMVWRPLLEESADEIRVYAESLGVPIAVDSSNIDESYRRNAIRHTVLPLLEQVVPGSTINLVRFSGLAAEDSDELDAQTCAILADWGDPLALDRGALLALPVAFRRRVVRLWIGRHAPVGLEVPANRVDEVLRVASVKERPRTVEIGEGLSVEIAGDSLLVRHFG